MSDGRLCRTLFMLLALGMAPTVKADLDGELRGAFDGLLISNTAIGEYVGQRRGVITGGSVNIRNRIMTPNIVSFVPPSFKGGCNGIDLFGGSFSYINSAQFTQLLRSVAQAAAGYAFQLAIEGMCPTCAQVMSKLQKDVQNINSLMRNSCTAAEALVDGTGLRSWHDTKMKEAAQLNTSTGLLEDYFSSSELTTESPAKATLASGNKTAIDTITGNIVFQALRDSEAATWFAHGDQQLTEALMSLTGTVIANPKSDGSDIKYDFRPNILKVRDLLDGGQVTIYQCESAECLLPDKTGNRQTIALLGIRDLARRLMFGDASLLLGRAGIVGKMYTKTGTETFTPDEINFVRVTKPGILGLIEELARERISVEFFADQMLDVVSTELVNTMVDDMYQAVDIAIKNTGKPLDSQMLEVMKDVRAQINEARRVNGETLAGITSLVHFQKMMKESLRSASNAEPVN